MARTQTMVQLNEELVAALDDEAARRGVSRSALIRTAVESLLHDASQAAIASRIVEGYRRIPQTTSDEWGDAAVWAERATTDLLARLDAEERAGGHAPW